MKIRQKLRDFWKEREGSDTVEMINSIAILLLMILVLLMTLVYVLEWNMVAVATRRVVREIEVSGIASNSQMDATFRSNLGSMYLENLEVSISDVTYHASGSGHIQLMDTFKVTGKASYRIRFIQPGVFEGYYFDFPICCVTTGMSEVYWRTPGT